MKLRSSSQDRLGYTVTEIIVVVTIVFLLIGIGVPGFMRMKASARSAHCVSNLRQIGIAINTHLADRGMRMPEWVPAREDVTEDLPALDTELLPYVSDVILFHCPSDNQRIWEKTGTSYFWNSVLNGQHLEAIDFLGLSENTAGIPLVADKENFHENVGDEVNVLYVDGHVKRELQFIVEK